MNKCHRSELASQQQVMNARTGKVERVFVNLEAVYPNPTDLGEEYSFEELRAGHRGWLSKQWKPAQQSRAPEKLPSLQKKPYVGGPVELAIDATEDANVDSSQQSLTVDAGGVDQTLSDITSNRDISKDGRSTRPRKKKLREVKGETQTSKRPRR